MSFVVFLIFLTFFVLIGVTIYLCIVPFSAPTLNPEFSSATPTLTNGTSTGTIHGGTISFVPTTSAVLNLPILFSSTLSFTPKAIMLSSLTSTTSSTGLFATNISSSGFTVNSTAIVSSVGNPTYSFSFIVV